MTPDHVQAWLDRQYVPSTLGWSTHDVRRLGPLLGLDVPDDYLAFLEMLGHLAHQLFGYDEDLRTPEAYARLRQEILDLDLEAWDGADQDPQFAEVRRQGLFLNQQGGFARWYLLCGTSEPTLVRLWLERDAHTKKWFHTEGPLLENLEARMTHFEGRVDQDHRLGGTLVYGRGRLPVGHAIGQELLELPHDGWRVELTPSQLERIRVMWRLNDL